MGQKCFLDNTLPQRQLDEPLRLLSFLGQLLSVVVSLSRPLHRLRFSLEDDHSSGEGRLTKVLLREVKQMA